MGRLLLLIHNVITLLTHEESHSPQRSCFALSIHLVLSDFAGGTASQKRPRARGFGRCLCLTVRKIQSTHLTKEPQAQLNPDARCHSVTDYHYKCDYSTRYCYLLSTSLVSYYYYYSCNYYYCYYYCYDD